VSSHYHDFIGQTPHTKDELCAKVFFASISGKVTPCAEIVEVGYFSAKEMWLMTLSEITRKIIESLVRDGHLS